MTVDVRVLGPLEVAAPGGHLTGRDFPSKKARRLFEVLVLAEGQTVSKDALLDALWRREMPRNPQATVETAVSLARKTIGSISDDRVIVTEPSGYRIDTDHVDVDLARLERAIAAAEMAPPGRRVRVLAEGLREVRGRLLEDQFATDWLLPRRERVARRVDLARVLLARSAFDDGAYEVAYEAAEASWTASDTVLEDAYAVGALALGAQGRRAEADRVLAMATERLARDGAAPGPALLAARERLRRPFATTVHARPLRVPDELVADAVGLGTTLPLLGREAERQAIVAAARSTAIGEGARWLHVTGGRGMGISRVLEAAIEWATPILGDTSAVVLPCAAGDARQELLFARRLSRSLSRRAGRSHVDGDAAGLFGSMADALDAAGPTMLVVDGVGSADEASVAVLRALAAGGAGQPLLVMTGGGPAPTGSDELTLAPLSEADVAPLGPGPRWEVTGGHPLVVHVTAAAARGGGALFPEGARMLGAMLDSLDPLARVVVGRTEYTTGEIQLAAVAADLHLDRSMVVDAALRARDAGVVEFRPDGRCGVTSALLTAILGTRS